MAIQRIMTWAQLESTDIETVAENMVNTHIRKGTTRPWFVFCGASRFRSCTASDPETHMAKDKKRWVGCYQLPEKPTLNERREVADYIIEDLQAFISQWGERLFHATGGDEGRVYWDKDRRVI